MKLYFFYKTLSAVSPEGPEHTLRQLATSYGQICDILRSTTNSEGFLIVLILVYQMLHFQLQLFRIFMWMLIPFRGSKHVLVLILLCSPLAFIEAAAAQSVTVKPTGYGFDPHSRKWNIYLKLYFNFFALVSRQSAALSSVTQLGMLLEFGRKWGTECLTRFPLSTLQCAGYSVKLISLQFLDITL